MYLFETLTWSRSRRHRREQFTDLQAWECSTKRALFIVLPSIAWRLMHLNCQLSRLSVARQYCAFCVILYLETLLPPLFKWKRRSTSIHSAHQRYGICLALVPYCISFPFIFTFKFFQCTKATHHHIGWPSLPHNVTKLNRCTARCERCLFDVTHKTSLHNSRNWLFRAQRFMVQFSWYFF